MNSNLILIVVINFLFIEGTTSQNVAAFNNSNGKLHPFFAVVRQSNKKMCGGAIITDEFVLTTANCMVGNKDSYTIHIGGDYNDVSLFKMIEKIHYYDSTNRQEHLALLETTTPIPLGYGIELIRLETDIEIGQGLIKGNVSAYAAQSRRPTDPKKLMQLFISTIPFGDGNCAIAMNMMAVPPLEKHFCAERAPNNLYCQGDEGDPMVNKGKLLGIAGKQFGCTGSNEIALFFNVPYYFEWIDNVTNTVRSLAMREDACDDVEDRNFAWFDDTMFDQLFLCQAPKCIDARAPSDLICIPTPISPIIFITTKFCITWFDETFNDSKIYTPKDNFKIRYRSILYAISEVTTGSKLLPFFAQKQLDIAIVKTFVALNFVGGIPILPVYPALEETLPPLGILFKYKREEGTQMVGIPVLIQTGKVCESEFDQFYDFKVNLEMFCVAAFCDREGDLYNTCTRNGGAPIFTAIGDLIGIVVYQENCETNQSTIAVRLSKFVTTLREQVKATTKPKKRGFDLLSF